MVRRPVHVLWHPQVRVFGVGLGGRVAVPAVGEPDGLPLVGTLPPLYPEWLGDPGFRDAHGVRFAYVAGEMANGIATVEMVLAMARARMLSFFGAAGLPLARIESALARLRATLGPDGPAWGANLIHSPQDGALEDATVDLYLRHDVRRVSASAFMALRPAVVRFAFAGVRTGPAGRPVRPRHVMAKVSRPEVAAQFLAPPPPDMLDALVRQGALSPTEAGLAARLPVAEDVTVEADSGGHTDNRPLVALLPAIAALRDDLAARHGYVSLPRVGCAGGIGTPHAVAAAFAMGAAYVLTGSINQSAVESGLSLEGKRMLAAAGPADVAMAPAADMFELGVRVQVLKRGTLFAARATRLYELYRECRGLEGIPPLERERLEREVFRAPLEDVWAQARQHIAAHDLERAARGDQDPKHRMAMVFRWYLGNASRWAIAGEPTRQADYQIWCGPAMGAFNAWVDGSFLADPARRDVVQIALNLLEGATVVTRAQQLRTHGVALPPAAFTFRPRPLRAE
jgi:PfaD family protein